jgi:acetoin utilization deacetylase AcuC-like enzyme
VRSIHTDRHRLRDPRTELSGGELVPPHECPARAETVVERLRERRLGEILEPVTHGLDPVLRVHDADFVRFLETAWQDWVADGHRGEAIPSIWPDRDEPVSRPDRVEGRIGWYAFSAETSISEGTWEAARAAADVALTARDLVAGGDRAAFALCRPPGHHASRARFGGYCFLNNAAIVAQAFLDDGADRVAVLDVDFHHGNGTQSIFYDRPEVLVASLHGDPTTTFPWYHGTAAETGRGAGEGSNRNYPLPEGTDWRAWSAALEDAAGAVARFGPDALVVSLGVDTFRGDPISTFRLESDDYPRLGTRLAALGLPTVFVMEGGYAVAEIGVNAVGVLEGFSGA